MPALRNVPRLDRYVYNLSSGWDGHGNPRQETTLRLDAIDSGIRSNRIALRTEEGHLNTTNPGETQYATTNEQPIIVAHNTATSDGGLLHDTHRFASASSGARSSRNHARRKDPYHIPRPRNAFIFFRSAYAEAQRSLGCCGQQNELSKDAAWAWARMSDAQKQEYRERALAEKVLHKKLFPHYIYSPGGKNGSGSGKLKASAMAGNGAGKKVTPSVASSVQKKAQRSLDGSSSPEASPCSDISLVSTLMVPETQATASMSAESSGSESGENLSLPAYATIHGHQDEKEKILVTVNTPISDLPLTAGTLPLADERFLDSTQGLFSPATPLDPIPLDSFGFGPGYGFQSYPELAMNYEPLPHLPHQVDQYTDVDVGTYSAVHYEAASAGMTTTLAPYLPHPSEFSVPSDNFDFLTDLSSSFSAVSYSFGLDPESDAINDSFENLNLNYDYGLDSDLTEADFQKIEVEVFDYASFFPSGVKDKGKETAQSL